MLKIRKRYSVEYEFDEESKKDYERREEEMIKLGYEDGGRTFDPRTNLYRRILVKQD